MEVKVCHALLMLEKIVCVENDVVTNLGYLFEPRFICPSVEILLFSARHLISEDQRRRKDSHQFLSRLWRSIHESALVEAHSLWLVDHLLPTTVA